MAQTDDRESRTRYKREDQGHSALNWLQLKSKTRQRSLACKFVARDICERSVTAQPIVLPGSSTSQPAYASWPLKVNTLLWATNDVHTTVINVSTPIHYQLYARIYTRGLYWFINYDTRYMRHHQEVSSNFGNYVLLTCFKHLIKGKKSDPFQLNIHTIFLPWKKSIIYLGERLLLS